MLHGNMAMCVQYILLILGVLINSDCGVLSKNVCKSVSTYELYCDDNYYCCDDNTKCCAEFMISVSAIIGIIIGSIVIFAFCIMCIMFLLKKKKFRPNQLVRPNSNANALVSHVSATNYNYPWVTSRVPNAPLTFYQPPESFILQPPPYKEKGTDNDDLPPSYS